jgi:hypothetical protein
MIRSRARSSAIEPEWVSGPRPLSSLSCFRVSPADAWLEPPIAAAKAAIASPMRRIIGRA